MPLGSSLILYKAQKHCAKLKRNMNIYHRNAEQFNLSIGLRCNHFTYGNQLRLEALCEGRRTGGSTHLS